MHEDCDLSPGMCLRSGSESIDSVTGSQSRPAVRCLGQNLERLGAYFFHPSKHVKSTLAKWLSR